MAAGPVTDMIQARPSGGRVDWSAITVALPADAVYSEGKLVLPAVDEPTSSAQPH